MGKGATVKCVSKFEFGVWAGGVENLLTVGTRFLE